MDGLMPLQELRSELKALANPEAAAFLQKYFKTGRGEYGEGDRFLGIKIPVLRGLARKYKALPLEQAVDLLQSPYHEERMLALLLLVRMFEKGDEPLRKRIYQTYLSHTRFINNWDLVDTSAPHIVGAYLENRSKAPLDKLSRSQSVWERRIAMLATQRYIKHGEFDDALRIADRLRKDEHDLIHKAAGWMLREIGQKDLVTLRAFLNQHHATMPRTMLRYAIEKLAPQERKLYLGR
jgi:3-methyladenine DNA glycosylase AlkD